MLGSSANPSTLACQGWGVGDVGCGEGALALCWKDLLSLNLDVAL